MGSLVTEIGSFRVVFIRLDLLLILYRIPGAPQPYRSREKTTIKGTRQDEFVGVGKGALRSQGKIKPTTST